MLDAPDPVGDFPFALFVGSSMALGFFFSFFWLWKYSFPQHDYYNTNLTRLPYIATHSQPSAEALDRGSYQISDGCMGQNGRLYLKLLRV